MTPLVEDKIGEGSFNEGFENLKLEETIVNLPLDLDKFASYVNFTEPDSGAHIIALTTGRFRNRAAFFA